MDRAKYMRGLHVHSSYILIILTYFPINYLDRSQPVQDFFPVPQTQ